MLSLLSQNPIPPLFYGIQRTILCNMRMRQTECTGLLSNEVKKILDDPRVELPPAKPNDKTSG